MLIYVNPTTGTACIVTEEPMPPRSSVREMRRLRSFFTRKPF